MNKIMKQLFLYSILLLAIYGCVPRKAVQQQPSLKKLPAAYSTQADTTNMADISWRTYFNDSLLVALLDTAVHNNPDMLAAMQRIEAAGSDVLLNRGAMFPTVNANLAAWQKKFGLYTMDGAGNITTDITPGRIVPTHLRDYYAGLQASWEIDVWGKLRNRKKAAVARYLASVEGKNLVMTNLVAEVAATYYELLALDRELEIIRENISLQQQALDMVHWQKEAAAANQLAVQQFEAQLLNTQAMEADVLQLVIESENRMNVLLGRYPRPVSRDTGLNAVNPVIATGIPAQLLRNRPDIREAEFELVAARADVKSARAAFYPSLVIDGYAGFQAFDPAFLFTTPQSVAYGIVGNLVAPLINRSAIKAEFRYANARQLEALYHYQETILNGYAEVSNQLAGISNINRVRQLKMREVEVLTQAIETAGELFKTGRATYLEVFIAQQQTLETKLQLVDARRRQNINWINIYRALGGGWK